MINYYIGTKPKTSYFGKLFILSNDKYVESYTKRKYKIDKMTSLQEQGILTACEEEELEHYYKAEFLNSKVDTIFLSRSCFVDMLKNYHFTETIDFKNKEQRKKELVILKTTPQANFTEVTRTHMHEYALKHKTN